MTFSKQCEFDVYGDNSKGIAIADLNGDGLMDLISITHAPNNTYRYNFYFFDGTQFTNGGTTGYYGFNTTVQDNDYITGDFNGDGKEEILIKSTQKLYNQYGNEIASGGITWGTKYYDELPFDRALIDFNGNGKVDLLVMDASGYRIYELNGSSFSLLTSGTDLKNTSMVSYVPLVGDFNGDGKTDILVNKYPNEYYILFSTGTGFEKKTLPNLNITGKWFTGDFNRDGKTDIVYPSQNDGYGFPLKIGLFDGNAFHFETYSSNFITASDMNMALSWKYLCFSDFDGDGFPDLCFTRYSDAFLIKSFSNNQNLLVNGITNGLNQTVSFDYNPITDAGYCGNSASTPAFPACNFRQPLYVVTSMENQAGNIYDENYYYYKGAKIHKQGKGFLGFEEVRVTNYQQNRKTTTQYGYNSTYFNTYPVKQTVTTTSGDSISRTNFESDRFITSGTKVIFPYIKKQITKDHLTGITKTTDYVYNSANHGNPSSITETQGSLVSQTVNTWEAKGGSTFKNRVTEQIITHSGIETSFSETKKFSYDTKARLTQKIDYYGNPKAVTTNYLDYDSIGNPHTVTTIATNCPTITTSSVFDATGRFMTSSTDALNNTSSAQYDPKTGVLQLQTDIAGLTTSYEYDGFQRVTKETTPTDIITNSRSWNISGDNLYKVAVTSQISGTQTTWYNKAGWETKTQSPGFLAPVVSEKEYNTKGQLYRSYLPGYNNKSTQYVEYTYDKYGRIKTENNLGRITSYGYSGLTDTITTPDGKSTYSTLNLSGLLASSTDAAGNSVTYTYNSLGKPVTTTSNGLTTYINYDNRGFQRALKDANLTDSIKYEYNAYGQLTKQTNARGQETAFAYDAAGRITTQVRPENTLTYQYVPSGNGIGQVQTVKKNNNTIQSYTYNSWGQPLSVTENIDNTNYTTSYIYNNRGQLTEKQSPSGLRVGYQYTNGSLTSMRNAESNALLWQVDEINALGQITESTLGNGLKRVSGYDTYHLPNQILLKNGNNNIDRIDYVFNHTTGNLRQRNDITNSRNEFFGYDNLNRLDSLRLNSGTINRMTYAANGNIQTKFDVGTYQYANSNHAVSGIADPVGTYSPPALDIANTSFNRTDSITLQGTLVKKLKFQYNADNQRNRSLYYENNVLKKTMIYVGNYEKEFIVNGSAKEYDYIYTPEGLSAIAIKSGGTRSFYYVNTDHLGSIRTVTTAAKAIQTRYYYDAWGKQSVTAGTSITNRGYLAQEHLNEFGLINLNARLYDPVLGRFLGVDPYVQEAGFTQSFNRYAYGLNNPFRYTDPNGEFWWLAAAAVYFLFFTDAGYQLQKYVSPIAIHIDVKFGTHQQGLGFDIGVGVPKLFPWAPWAEYGATYYWKNYGDYQGWETRQGKI
ncbi:hypothetical protein FACS189413_17050 [Bacteroidia bacterium]|nr:hypothetical protein FACS189413_17050 [Bacteroidia bacterium]